MKQMVFAAVAPRWSERPRNENSETGVLALALAA